MIPKSIEAHNIKLLKFCFINFKDGNDAKKAFVEAKKSAQVKNLISTYHDEKKDFLYFAQPKVFREQYLRMVKKNQMQSMALQTQNNLMNALMRQQMNRTLDFDLSKQAESRRQERGPEPRKG